MKITRIGDVAKIFNGYAFKSDEYSSNGYQVIRITNVQNGYISNTNPKFIKFNNKELERFVLKEGDILISLTGNVGRAGRVEKNNLPAVLNQRVGKVVIESKEILPDYLLHILKSNFVESKLIKKAKGIAQKNIGSSDIENLEFPLPTIENQKQIIKFLDQANELIQKRRQAISLLDEYIKSVFLEMFGDPKTNPKQFPLIELKELYIDSKNGTKCGPFGSALKKGELVDSGIPVWNMDNISTSGQVVMPFHMWITEEKFLKLEPYSVKDGDVIISRAGTVGKMCVAKTSEEKSIISTNLIRVRFGNKLLALYFVSLMNYCKGRVGRLKTGADGAFTHMNTGVLDSLTFPYPPIETQNKFSEIVQKTELVKQKMITQLEELENNFQALMQKAFKGELTN